MIIDYTSRDFESIKIDLTDKLKILAPELTNTNESEFALVMIDLFAYIGDILSYSLDRYANEVFLETAIQRDSVIKLCNLIGYQLGKPKSATAKLKFSIDSPISNDVIIPAKTICYTEGSNKIYFETNELATITAGNTYVEVLAKEGETKNEIIGYSDGTSNQTFELTFYPLIDNVELLVNSEEWLEVSSFFNSDNTSKEYVINNQNPIEIQFGDGTNGAIPPLYATIFASYRTGGGTQGNVGSNSITYIKDKIYDSENNIVTVTVNNEISAYGGENEESIQEAKLNAPKSFASTRAVTESDYNNLISLFSDDVYGKTVKSICKRDDNIITQVNIFTWSKDSDDLLIVPSTELKNSLTSYLDELSMIGITNNVANGLIKTINITGDVYIQENKSISLVQTDVENALKDLFNYINIEPGSVIAKSKIYKIINSVSGVSYLDLTLPSENVQLLYNEMAKLGTISITYQYE